MHITTMHTLAFTIRAHNGRHQLAEDTIKISAETIGVDLIEREYLPLPEGETSAIRSTKILVRSTDLDRLESYWNELQRALALVGVEATSP